MDYTITNNGKTKICDNFDLFSNTSEYWYDAYQILYQSRQLKRNATNYCALTIS